MSFRVVTRAMLAAGAAENWRKQYVGSVVVSRFADVAIHDALVMLGTDPSPEDVDAVIGNASFVGNTTWTTLFCDCCRERGKGPWITFGEGYDEQTICAECIGLAAGALLEVAG